MNAAARLLADRRRARREDFDLAGLLFDFDPHDTRRLALVSGEISSASFRGRTMSASASRRPIHETSTLLDGRKGARFDPGGTGDEIALGAGGPVGNSPFSVLSVHKVNTGGAVGLTRVGADQGGAFPVGANAVVGGYYASEFWNEGSGVVSPHGPTHDTSVHAWVKTFDGSTVRAFQDGEVCVGTDGTYQVFAQDHALLDGSIGIGSWTTGYPADGIVYRAVWANACWNRASVDNAFARARAIFPSLTLPPRVVIDGTSIEFGYGVTPGTNDWGKVATNALGVAAGYLNFGVSGQTIGFNANCPYGYMLSDQATQVLPRFSAMRRDNILLVGSPTNDIYFGTSVAQTLANLAAYVAAAEAAGFLVLVSTIPSRYPDATYVGDAPTLLARWAECNTGIRATYPAEQILDFAADVPEVQDYTNATYFIEAPTGIHPTAAGHAAMGAYAGPKIKAFRSRCLGW